MGDTHVQQPTQTQTPAPPAGGTPATTAVPNDQAASTADVDRRRKAAGLLSKSWLSALGGLVPADATGPAPKIQLRGGDPAVLQQGAYRAAVTDAAGSKIALDYLSAAGAEDKFSGAIRLATDNAATDLKTFGELRTAITALTATHQDLNGPGLVVLAKLAILTDDGKEFLRTGDHGPVPAPLAQPLADYIQKNFVGTDEATNASRAAYTALLAAIRSPAGSGDKAPTTGALAPLSGPELKKAEDLITAIKNVFAHSTPLGAKADAATVAAKKATPDQMKQLQGLIGGASGPVRDWVYAWRDKEGPNKGKGVLELFGSYMSPTQVEELNAVLDPVERLFKDLLDQRNGRRDRKLPATTEYQILHDFLAGYPGDGGAPTRKRVQNDARIMAPFLMFQSAEHTKILIRMIVTGREQPDAIDKVHEAADKGDSNAAIQAIYELAGKEPTKLQELRTDLIFVHRLKDKCGAKVKFNGVETTAYELFLRICGVDPNNTKEMGSVDKQTESNPDKNAKPPDATEMAHVEDTLYKPYAKPIADQLNSWYTRDSKVMEALRNFQTAAAKPDMVDLLRRAKMAPGPTMANRIQMLGCDVRLKCQRGLSDDNLHEAERILGFVADQASTGVIGGAGALATDNKPKSESKVGLEQALRETTLEGGGVLTQVIHDAAKALADELGRWFGARAATVRSIWNGYKGTVNEKVCADLREKTGLPRVWAVELLANAFLPVGGGSLESKLKSELGKEHNDVITEMGMSPTDIAARRTLADDKATQDNSGTDKGNAKNAALLSGANAQVQQAEQAEQFRAPAKGLFDGLTQVTRLTDNTGLQSLAAKLDAGFKLGSVAAAPGGVTLGPKPAPAAETDVSAKPGGVVGDRDHAPTDFSSFYKREYGIDPRRHAVEVAKALATRERTAQQVGDLLGVKDASLFAPPAAPKGEEFAIDERNQTLVGPTFSIPEAKTRAQKIWDLLHDNGQVQLIRQQFGDTQEEDRLIQIAFRQLSGGIEIHFFLQQHLAQQKAFDARGQSGNMGMQVGGGGTGDADKRSLHVIGSSAETEAAAERASTGKISIEKQLSTLIVANNMDEVYRILEHATESERRAILANGDLMTQLRKFGDDSYEWNRIYKTLTGQADLFDKLESRAHGKHGIIGGLFEGTDEKGMTQDIKDHAKKRKDEIRAEVIKTIFEGKEPTDKDNKGKLDKEVIRRLKIEFASDLENPSIRALLTDELSGAELAKTEGQLLNSGEESKLASVLTEGDMTEDEEKILDDIKKMSPADRKKARENPEYIAQLRKAIQTQGTWRDAMILLESNEDGSKGENADNYAKLERASRSVRQDTTELMFEQDDVIEALSKLTPDEYARLKANPRLQAQILTSLEGHPEQLAKARQMMAFNAADAGQATGLTVGDTSDPAKGIYAKSVVERLAFLKFSAENQVSVGASRGWGVLLQAAVAVYNMKLKPSEIEKATKEEASAKTEEGNDKPLRKEDVQQGSGDQSGGQQTISKVTPPGPNGAAKPMQKAPDQQPKPADPKAGEDAVEERLRQEILTDTQAAFKQATTGWGTQKSENSSHERTQIDSASQQSIIENAILHKSDPSNSLLMASTGVLGDDEERIKETLRTASDDKLIREWSNCIQHAPNGAKSMKEKYLDWKTARGNMNRSIDAGQKQEPGAASTSGDPAKAKAKQKPYAVGSPEWVARTQFKTHVLDTSEILEDLLLKYTGGLFADDKKTGAGEKRVRDNSEWLEWRTVIRDRLPNLDREKIGTEIGAGADNEAMEVLKDPQAKVLSDTLGQLDYDTERYLVDRGEASNYNMDRVTAGGEGLALDNAMDDYRRQVMTSVISKPGEGEKYGDIDPGEAARIGDAKARFQQNDSAFREAKSQVATIAASVVALLITAVVTILTAGTATGPLATILIAAITAAAASTGANATKKAVQGTDFEFGKEGLEAIARDTIMGAVTAGTTWYAGKIVNGLFSAGSAAEQAAILARTAADPGFFMQMGRAMAENSLQTGMQGMFESGMAAFDPAMWLDGWSEGWRRGSAAARDRASEVPLEMLRAAVIAGMSHTANAGINKLTGGGGGGEGWHGQHAATGNRMDLGDRTALVGKTMAHGAREGVIMGGAELLLDEKTYRPEGQKPGEMLGHVANSSVSMATMSAQGSGQADAQGIIEMHMKDAAGSARAKAADRELTEHGQELTPHEQKLYAELATQHGGVDTTVLSIAEFKQARQEMVEKAVVKFAAEHERPLNTAERASFESYVAAAPTLGEFIARADGGPSKTPGIKIPPSTPNFDKPADLDKVRERAKDVLAKLETSTAGTTSKATASSDVGTSSTEATKEGNSLLADLNGHAKTPSDHAAVYDLASRFNACDGELRRALDTVNGATSMEALKQELAKALAAAETDPKNANAHKALHQLVVEGYVAQATSPGEVGHAAESLPKKLAELRALVEEIRKARDNAARRALNDEGTTPGTTTDAGGPKPEIKETKTTPEPKKDDAKTEDPAKKEDKAKKEDPEVKKDEPKNDNTVKDPKADDAKKDDKKFDETAKGEAKQRLEKKLGRELSTEEQRQFEHMFKTHGMPEAESLMDKWLELKPTPMPSIDDQMAQKATADQHSQIETHNHITGVVEPEAFLAQMNAAGVKANPGESKWMPMLEALHKLEGQHAYETDPDGKTKIKKRGVAGDAHEAITEALAKIKTMDGELANMGGEEATRQREAIDKVAKDAIDAAMRATKETDFNSAYELRDELIKEFYGKAERDKMLADAKIPADADFSDPALAAAYAKHFEGRPRVLDAIKEAVAAQAELTDPSKKPTEKRAKELKKKLTAVGEQMAYDSFLMDTLEKLARDGLRYSEQSVSANKMDARFDPEQMGWVKAKLEAKLLASNDKETAQRVKDLEVKYVAMMNTSAFGGHDDRVDKTDINTVEPGQKPGKEGSPRFSNENLSDKEFSGLVDQIARQALRPDSVGTDIAGMEHMVFDKTGKARFKELYERLLMEAKKNKVKLVLRPHVGEGAIDTVPGEGFSTEHDRQVKDGKLTAQARAEDNVAALIDVCQAIADAHGGVLPPEVVVRFGHATHATPEMAEKMAKLGIIAEINLGSNERTGAESPTKHDLSKGDKKAGDTPELKERPLDEHSLMSFVYNGADIILSTDGHSVMSTGIGQEYATAKGVIDDVIHKGVPVVITRDQALAEIKNGAKISPPPEGQKHVSITYDEMSNASKQRFDEAYRKLFEAARKYYDGRRRETDGVTPPDDSAPKKAEAQMAALDAADHEADARKGGAKLEDKDKLTTDQREVLQTELKRQVPDVELMSKVEAGTAKSVVALVFPGSSGDFGIKKMNDEAIGLQRNSAMLKERDALVASVFANHGLEIVDQTYKCTTVVSAKSPAELAADLKGAMAEIDRGMKDIVLRHLKDGLQAWRMEADKYRKNPGHEEDANFQNAEKRVKEIQRLLTKTEGNTAFQFDMQLGASEIQGKEYGDVLAAEMNASKAAIMSRDAKLKRSGPEIGDGRANIFDEKNFVTFCQDTIQIRKDLVGKTIKFHDKDVVVMTEKGINFDVLRDLRKGKIKPSAADKAVFDELERYFTRINALDYFKSFTGPETEAQGEKVAEVQKLVKSLKDNEPMSKEMAEQIRAILAGEHPQSNTASEAEFYNRAEGLKERVVLNADIKDMGLDLFQGYEDKMTDAAKPGADTKKLSQSAADKIVEQKRRAETQFRKFYENYLMKKALAEAEARHRPDLVKALLAEKEPMILLGGDELTISLHPAFEELGLLELAIRKLTNPDSTNSRVAVTHTDPDLGGRFGHLRAMEDSQAGHDLLKGFEVKARALRDAAPSLEGKDRKAALALAEEIDRMYTSDRDGKTSLMKVDGTPANLPAMDAEIERLVKTGKGSTAMPTTADADKKSDEGLDDKAKADQESKSTDDHN